MMTAKFTQGVTVWVPQELRTTLEHRAEELEVSLGTVVREILRNGRKRMRPYKLNYGIPTDAVQLSFMVSPELDEYLRGYAARTHANLSIVVRAHLLAGIRE